MKHFFILFLACFSLTLNAQVTLSAGDIAFIGYNTDSPDAFTIITLAPIGGSDKIYFTDQGVVNSGAWLANSEDHWLFTAPVGGIPCGTIISFTDAGNSVTVNGVTGATMVWQSGGVNNNFNLSGGDQILAYQVTSPGIPATPSGATFIAGVHGDDGGGSCLDATTKWNISSCVSSTGESALPPGLTNGVDCVSLFPVSGTEEDNAKYTGSLSGTASTIRALINDHSNWTTNNTTPYPISPASYSGVSVTCPPPCADPTIPTVTYSPATICSGGTATLTISGTLNDATAWHVYTGACGGTSVGSTSGSTINVTPASPSTTYFVRGEGGCVTPGSCGAVTVNVAAVEDASFSYSASSYCSSGADPTPTITGVTGGSFSSAPAGLSLQGASGLIDLSASSPGTYTITYTTGGACPGTSNQMVTISAFDDASFSYGTVSYCASASDPSPTITGLSGGSFSSTPSGLSINVVSGLIDISASNPGNYTVSYQTNGTCPNTSNVSVTIDNINPIASCQNITVFLDGTGSVTITPSDIDGGTTDNCGAPSLSVSQSAFTCAHIGTNTVTLTATDGMGNADNCNATVTVLDTVSPVITCPGNQTESPNASCQLTLPDYTGLGTASDNCTSTPTITQSPVAGTLVSSTTTITLTATDASGNSSQCTFDVLLVDGTAPVAVCQNITVFLDGSGNASIVAADLDGGSSDNCSGLTLSASQTAFTCADLGANNVILTATDGSANTDNCIGVVTIMDTVSPIAMCQNIDVTLDGTGNGSIIAADIDAGSTDNCGSVTLSASQTAFTVADVGPNSITLTVDDGNGNTSQCTAIVTVINPIVPPTSAINDPNCGSTISMATNIYATSIPGTSQYRFKFVNTSTNNTLIVTRPNFWIRPNLVPGILYGATYEVTTAVETSPGVFGPYHSTPCVITTPSITSFSSVLLPSDCNISTLATMDQNLYANGISGSVKYEFKWTEVSTSSDFFRIRNTPVIRASLVPGISYGETYLVSVRFQLADGSWSAYGSACTISTPTPTSLLSQVATGDCNGSFTANQTIHADGIIGAIYYEFRFDDGNGNVYQRVINTPQVRPSQVVGLVDGTYMVTVRWQQGNGTWSNYGTGCNLTIANGVSFQQVLEEKTNLETNSNAVKSGEMAAANLEVSIFPNPNTGHFYVQTTLPMVKVEIYTMTGQLIFVQDPKSTVIGLDLTRFENGIYLVKAYVNDTVITKKVIKQ